MSYVNPVLATKERPILFSGPMVRALLAGTKTQTRRAIQRPVVSKITGQLAGWRDRFGNISAPERNGFGYRGDRLWVRETTVVGATGADYADGSPAFLLHEASDALVEWWNRHVDSSGRDWARVPSIFMPRALSRITLEITDVRVQRLQEISNDDARAEGVATECEEKSGDFHGDLTKHLTHDVGCHVEAYERLWDEINFKRAPWSSNPWVWAITFKVLA